MGSLFTVYYSCFFLANCVKIALKPSDFSVFLEAAAFISEGNSSYNEWIFVSEGNYCLYFYSPFWAILLIPFSYLLQFVPQSIWLALNLFFLYRIWRLLEGCYDKSGKKKGEWVKTVKDSLKGIFLWKAGTSEELHLDMI